MIFDVKIDVRKKIISLGEISECDRKIFDLCFNWPDDYTISYSGTRSEQDPDTKEWKESKFSGCMTKSKLTKYL